MLCTRALAQAAERAASKYISGAVYHSKRLIGRPYTDDLQREREQLLLQLQRCEPQEVDRLQAELARARRQASEASYLQEEVARHEQLWREAEARAGKLQVCA